MNRSIIKIFGIDAESFLQNLISNDLKKITEDAPIYSCLLNPHGRYQFDFFIIKKENYFLIDIQESQSNNFLKALTYRKLISKVNFEILKDYKVYNTKLKLSNSLISYQDPRLPILGYRTICNNLPDSQDLLLNYNEIRFNNAVPEGEDFTFDKSIPIEYGMDELGAISYNKGCYLGQEFSNSAKNRMLIRKRLISISSSFEILKNDIIYNKEGIKVGEVVSSLGNIALALFYMSYLNEETFINNKIVKKTVPNWVKIFSLE